MSIKQAAWTNYSYKPHLFSDSKTYSTNSEVWFTIKWLCLWAGLFNELVTVVDEKLYVTKVVCPNSQYW